MYHRQRRKIVFLLLSCCISSTICKSIVTSEKSTGPVSDNFENNIIDFDEDYSLKFNKKYGVIPWDSNDKFNKEMLRYTLIKDTVKEDFNNVNVQNNTEITSLSVEGTTSINDYSVIPLELISTTENELSSIIDSTTEDDLTVIPLSTTKKIPPTVEIKQTVTLPTSTQTSETTEYEIVNDRFSSEIDNSETSTTKREVTVDKNIDERSTLNATTDESKITTTDVNKITTTIVNNITTTETNKLESTTQKIETTTLKEVTATTFKHKLDNKTNLTTTSLRVEKSTLTTVKPKEVKTKSKPEKSLREEKSINVKTKEENSNLSITSPNSQKKINKTNTDELLKTNSSTTIESRFPDSLEIEEDVPSFSELDTTDETEVPEDYYDNKDVIPTTAPKNDALSVIFGLAGSMVESVVESVAERVVPKSIFDLFKRMQRQNEALEAERLRSREENGGLGQFGRGILKSISSGLSKPLSQLMAGARDIGSLDNDRGFLSSISSVANAAVSYADAFKDRVQAIYPGTVWCGDGHSATARSSDLGLFFFTDTCCRQHDACKIFIRAGETKYGLTNTGLFTRSHCSCDQKFRECLRKTNSLVSAQIGLTYFNVLGPQCFRKAHPIVKCVKRTRITGQKCEEYELDYTKPKMWQWFDNETF